MNTTDFRTFCGTTLLALFAQELRSNSLHSGVYQATNNTLRNTLASNFGVLQPNTLPATQAAIKAALEASLLSVIPAPQEQDGTDPASWALLFTLGLSCSIDGLSSVHLILNGEEFNDNYVTPADPNAPAAAPATDTPSIDTTPTA